MELKKLKGCPSCNGEVIVTEYYCPKCDITVRGKFEAGPFDNLNREQVGIVGAFLASGGNIKQMEARLGLSYPTVKTRLREINIALGLDEIPIESNDRIDILKNLEEGKMDV
ncbi:DUF2089 domain-containing protein, partial [bacterium]|nr:DUF2089 domain-containing protein [bacterium]